MGSFQKTYNDPSFLSELEVPRPPDNHIKPERRMFPIVPLEIHSYNNLSSIQCRYSMITAEHADVS